MKSPSYFLMKLNDKDLEKDNSAKSISSEGARIDREREREREREHK